MSENRCLVTCVQHSSEKKVSFAGRMNDQIFKYVDHSDQNFTKSKLGWGGIATNPAVL